MLAQPTRKEGLTGEKAAKLLRENCWGEIGIPAIITTDQDSRFTSSYFQTVRNLAGCRLAFSQAHRPQAIGRAEVAGKVLREIMRKLYWEEARSWVLLSPMAIRIRHDTVDLESGYSPYQLVFGRDRPGFGIPWPVVRECREAAEWMEERESPEHELGGVLRKRIVDSLRRASQGRPVRIFSVGYRVWLKNPKGKTGPGLAPNWLGPYFVTQQVEQHCFGFRPGGAGRQPTDPNSNNAWKWMMNKWIGNMCREWWKGRK